MRNLLLFAYLGGVLLTPASAGEHARRLEHRVKPGALFQVDAGPGALSIVGQEGLTEIIVKATLFVPGAEGAECEAEVDLALDPTPSGARLVAHFKRRGSFLRWLRSIGRAPRIDLEITVPLRMNCEIKDGSGGIVLRRISGNVAIEDGSGSIDIRGIQGSLAIQDGSGAIRVEEVTGDVRIYDGSGEMLVTQVGGDLKIHDGSGGIEVDGVAGDVHLERVGSGPVVTRNIRGRLIQPKP